MAADFCLDLAKELVKLLRRKLRLKPKAEKLKCSIDSLLPILHEIRCSSAELPSHRKKQLDKVTRILCKGTDLVRSVTSASPFNVAENIKLSSRMDKIEKKVSKFIKWTLPAQALAEIYHLRVNSIERLKRIERSIEENALEGPKLREQKRRWLLQEMEEREGVDVEGLGMKIGKEKVKEMLLDERDEMSVVGVCGMGGSGKTTLVKDICRDLQIKDYFKDRIIFETVSQSPNLEELKSTIWEKIMCGNSYMGTNDSVPPWMFRLEQNIKRPTLIVLDDVWSLSQLEKLIFNKSGCKTLVVSRFRFPEVVSRTYEVELLKEEEALSLFCVSAFRQSSIPQNFDMKLTKQVVEECKGLPLALKVIGASLRGQPPIVWQSAKNKLSRGEAISNSHEEKLIERMAVSIGCLSAKARDCFLDLASFPEDRKIPLAVLINVWIELHDLLEEDALTILIELSDKHLISLVKDPQNRWGDIYSGSSGLYVTQHDVLRDLSLHMGNSENLKRRKRLVMPKRECQLPREWLRNSNELFDAQIVSIHTGEMKDTDWCQMNFPDAEVLILNFSSRAYFLPPFIENMPKLKTLVIINSGSEVADLHNLSVFDSMQNLSSLWLEKIRIPPLSQNTVPLLNLRKISLVLCEVSRSFTESTASLPQIFPCLSELSIDHCIDVLDVPPIIGDFKSLEKLSITNCHDLNELPPELENLSSLMIFRVYGCPSLKKLPQEICGLKRLMYLDISQCMNMKSLPEGIGQMQSLERIDMQECSQIEDLPASTRFLTSLHHVICDEGISFRWKKTIPELQVQIAEEHFTLDWLSE